ncbi:MAG: cupin domain-containing protein, partial [Solirubrobacteraceae bacterium]
ASGADAGQEIVVPHHEMGPADPDSSYVGGQEEVYVVLRGAVTFTLDGNAQRVEAGQILFVPPAVHRSAVADVDGSLVLGVGGTPGKPYSGIDPQVEITPPLPGSVAARRAADAQAAGDGDA